MSQTDSFIDEVTEEVRRDKLYKTLRKYGWIGVLVVLLLVGGTAWREVQKSQFNAKAEATGDAILSALEAEEPDARISALGEISPEEPGANAIVAMLTAAEESLNGDPAAAAQKLLAAAAEPDVPEIYRHIATLKALAIGGDAIPEDERRLQLQGLAAPGNPLRLLAEEQLALLEVAAGNTDAAIAQLTKIIADAEASAGLRVRATRLIVALGGSVDAT